MNPRSTDCEADTLTTTPSRWRDGPLAMHFFDLCKIYKNFVLNLSSFFWCGFFFITAFLWAVAIFFAVSVLISVFSLTRLYNVTSQCYVKQYHLLTCYHIELENLRYIVEAPSV